MNFHFPFTVKLPEFGCFCQPEEGEVLLRSAPLFGGLSLRLRGGGLERRGHLDQRLDGMRSCCGNEAGACWGINLGINLGDLLFQ